MRFSSAAVFLTLLSLLASITPWTRSIFDWVFIRPDLPLLRLCLVVLHCGKCWRIFVESQSKIVSNCFNGFTGLMCRYTVCPLFNGILRHFKKARKNSARISFCEPNYLRNTNRLWNYLSLIYKVALSWKIIWTLPYVLLIFFNYIVDLTSDTKRK